MACRAPQIGTGRPSLHGPSAALRRRHQAALAGLRQDSGSALTRDSSRLANMRVWPDEKRCRGPAGRYDAGNRGKRFPSGPMRLALRIFRLAIGLASLLGAGAASAGTLVEFPNFPGHTPANLSGYWRDLIPVCRLCRSGAGGRLRPIDGRRNGAPCRGIATWPRNFSKSGFVRLSPITPTATSLRQR